LSYAHFQEYLDSEEFKKER
jgi:hypothetical protein